MPYSVGGAWWGLANEVSFLSPVELASPHFLLTSHYDNAELMVTLARTLEVCVFSFCAYVMW
jgi:hypothetical protein